MQMKLIGALFIVIAIVFSFILSKDFQTAKDFKIDPDNISMMKESARAMSGISSVGGRTLDEAFYSSYGFYLNNQADVYKIQVISIQRQTDVIRILGFLFCALSTVVGIWMITYKSLDNRKDNLTLPQQNILETESEKK